MKKIAIKSEQGAATIIEYTIVLPIVMAIICILIFSGYLVYDRASLEASAERAALYMAKTIADQNYTDITTKDGDGGSNEIESISISPGSIKTAPYRFLFSNVSDTAALVENQTRQDIRKNQLLRNDTVNVKVSVKRGIFYRVTVSVTEEFYMPGFLATLDLPALIHLQSEASVYVNEPAEFIRNADLCVELVQRADQQLGVSAKVKEVVSQISFFKKKTS